MQARKSAARGIQARRAGAAIALVCLLGAAPVAALGGGEGAARDDNGGAAGAGNLDASRVVPAVVGQQVLPDDQRLALVAAATDTEALSAAAVPTASRTATGTRTASATATITRTRVPTRTATPTVTVTMTRMATGTATPRPTRTQTRTASATRTGTNTRTRVPTVTSTPTRTGTRTQTPTSTPTASPTPTATCASGTLWNVSAARLISSQSGGEIWLTRTVPTDVGWGIFWLRNDPDGARVARLYYAHVDFAGEITVAPMRLASIPRLDARSHYYMVAWNAGHYGLLTAERELLYYQSVSLEGAVSQRHAVGPPLFVDPAYDQEADGDVYAYPGGFLGVVEGECAGHSCSYAFKLDTSGVPTTAIVNLVDFDLTHQFYPSAAFDGSGFAILSVKDIRIADGGVMTKYWSAAGTMAPHRKIVKSKEYLWDEFPDIAHNGNHFAALWTENSARSGSAPWQIHFATFRRNSSGSTDIADRVIDTVSEKTNQRWTTQVHPMGTDWVAQYASRGADGSVVAVYELLGSDARTGIYLEPFPLTADALGSSRHTVAPAAGVLGIARGSYVANGTTVEFYTLAPPSCR